MGQVYRMNTKKTKGAKGAKKAVRLKSVALILLMVYIAYTLTAYFIAIRKSQTEETRVKAQIEQMEAENKRLKEEIEKMQSDEYIEKVARERLGLIKSGEVMFVDVNHEPGGGSN